MSQIIINIIFAVLIALVAVLTWVLSRSRKYCPQCGKLLPVFRKPGNIRQALLGGWTCPDCGCKIDRNGAAEDGQPPASAKHGPKLAAKEHDSLLLLQRLPVIQLGVAVIAVLLIIYSVITHIPVLGILSTGGLLLVTGIILLVINAIRRKGLIAWGILAAAGLVLIIVSITEVPLITGELTLPQSPTPPAAAPASFSTYQNPTYNIEIKYPQDWKKQEAYSGSIVSFMSPAKTSAGSQTNLSVFTPRDISAKPLTLDQLTQQLSNAIKQTQMYTDINIVDSGAAILSNNPAHRLTITGKKGQFNLQLMEIYTIKNNKVYMLQYGGEISSYPVFLDTAQQMIDSFKIY